MIFTQLDHNENAIWSLFLASSYLKLIHYQEEHISKGYLHTSEKETLLYTLSVKEPKQKFDTLNVFGAEDVILIFFRFPHSIRPQKLWISSEFLSLQKIPIIHRHLQIN